MNDAFDNSKDDKAICEKLVAEALAKSWAPEVIADSSGQWAGNALRFPTKEEAEANVRDLMGRWMLVRETRVVPSQDPPNYRWDPSQGGLVRL